MNKLNSILYAIFLFALISCTNQSNHNIDYDGLAILLDSNVKKDIIYLKKEIFKKEIEIGLANKFYADYKIKTTEYIIYIEKLELLCSKVEINPFFEDGKLTSEGELFIKKTNDYVKVINTLNNDITLRNRIESLLGMKDVLIDNNVYAKYIDWNFNGLPKSFFIHEMSTRIRNVLLIQNQLMLMTLFEECNKK